VDEENLIRGSRALRATTIACADFEEALERAEEGDFVYLDPPYHPVSETGGFTTYVEGGFDLSKQAKRPINCRGDRRGAISELIVRNY